jgi:hypothetical protein
MENIQTFSPTAGGFGDGFGEFRSRSPLQLQASQTKKKPNIN